MTIVNYSLYLLLGLVPFIWSRQINGNYFNAKTFCIYFLSGLCLFSITFSHEKLKKIHLSKPLQIALLFFCGSALIRPFIDQSLVSFYQIFKPLAFCIIAYFIFISEDLEQKNRSSLLNFFSGLFIFAILALNLYDIYDFRFIQNTLDQGRLLGTFGNVNMFGEFFVLALPLVYVWSNDAKKVSDILRTLVLALWVFVIIYTRSRSSWIGLALFVAFVLYKNFNKKDILAFTLGLLFYMTCLWLPVNQTDTVDEVKKNSFIERVSLYKASLELIVDHPLGISLGTFTNEIIPYRMHQDYKPYELEFADQPHSELLKWGIEYGWLGLLFAIYVLFSLFKNIYLAKNKLLISAFLVFVPQMLFQFPFENPASLLILTVYFGLWLKTQKKSDYLQMTWLKIGLASLATLVVTNSLLFIVSVVSESQFQNNFELTSTLCSIYPANQKNCNYKNMILIQQGKTTEFRNELKSELPYSYMTSDLQRILPNYFSKINDEKHLCENLMVYKIIYPAQKYFEEKNIHYCTQKYAVPVRFESPQQFRSDYKNWIEKIIL